MGEVVSSQLTAEKFECDAILRMITIKVAAMRAIVVGNKAKKKRHENLRPRTYNFSKRKVLIRYWNKTDSRVG